MIQLQSQIVQPQTAAGFQPTDIQFMYLGSPEETALVSGYICGADGSPLDGVPPISYTLTVAEYAAWGADNNYVYNLCVTNNGYTAQTL